MKSGRKAVLHGPLGLLCLLLGPATASAAIVKDQAYEPAVFDGSGEVHDLVEFAQTFTVGRSGTLTAVDLYLWRGASLNVIRQPLVADIRGTAGGVPTDGNLATVVLQPAEVPIVQPDWVPIDLPGEGLAVTTGDVLAIALRSEEVEPDAYRALGTLDDGYTGGQTWARLLIGSPPFIWQTPASTRASDLKRKRGR